MSVNVGKKKPYINAISRKEKRRVKEKPRETERQKQRACFPFSGVFVHFSAIILRPTTVQQLECFTHKEDFGKLLSLQLSWVAFFDRFARHTNNCTCEQKTHWVCFAKLQHVFGIWHQFISTWKHAHKCDWQKSLWARIRQWSYNDNNQC